MADVFTVVGQDHAEVKRMLAELDKGPSRVTGSTEDQLALRKKMTEQLIIEESKHEALEEMYFWPGRARLRQATPPVPEGAVQSVKADVDEIKERTHR